MANDVTVTFNGQPMGLVGAVQQVNAALGQMQTQTDSMTASAGSNGNMIDSLSDKVGNAFSGALRRGVGALQSFGMQLMQVFETMTLWRVMDQVTQALQQMTDAWFDLNVQTEKNVFTWKYLFGSNAIAQNMAEWTKTFSMQIPYTRQDLLNSITTLAGLNLNEKQIQQYLPMLASLGATRAPNANLSDIARYIAGAEYGRSMMLRYELHINPADLAPYGYIEGHGGKAGDPKTFLPALYKWTQAKGYMNAAQDIAHQTWWGEWSSFIDRIQNFQLDMGGKGFAQLKTFLNDISGWLDAHTSQLQGLADLLAGALASGLKTAGDAAGEFFQALIGGKVSGVGGGIGSVVRGLGQGIGSLVGGVGGGFAGSGGVEALAGIFKTIGTALGASGTQSTLHSIGTIIGMAVGTGLHGIEAVLKGIMQFADSPAGHALGDLVGAVLGLVQAGARLITVASPLQPLLGLVFALLQLLTPAIELITIGIQGWTEALNWLVDELGKLFHWLDPYLQQAADWGKHLIENLVGGIKGAWDHTGGAVINWIGNAIKSVLGHSKPETGPLHDDDVWMTHMMQGFEQQIIRGTPRVVAATRQAATQIGAPMLALAGAGSVTSYGNSATNLTVNAATEARIQAMIDASIKATYRWGNTQLRAPGGFRRPGGYAF